MTLFERRKSASCAKTNLPIRLAWFIHTNFQSGYFAAGKDEQVIGWQLEDRKYRLKQVIHSIEYLHVCGTASFVIRLVRVVLVVAWGREPAVRIRLSIQGGVDIGSTYGGG